MGVFNGKILIVPIPLAEIVLLCWARKIRIGSVNYIRLLGEFPHDIIISPIAWRNINLIIAPGRWCDVNYKTSKNTKITKPCCLFSKGPSAATWMTKRKFGGEKRKKIWLSLFRKSNLK